MNADDLTVEPIKPIEPDELTETIEKLTGYRAPLPLLGEMLVALRKERGLSQTELAGRLDTVQESIARMEQAKYRSVSLERLVKVAEALGAAITVELSTDAPPPV